MKLEHLFQLLALVPSIVPLAVPAAVCLYSVAPVALAWRWLR